MPPNLADARRAELLTDEGHVDRIDRLLPQTQCRRCGYEGCRPYAQAIAAGAPIDRCPPGGTATLASLAALLGRELIPLDASRGAPGPRRVARIDNRTCIGCTKCLRACPVDAIVGASGHQHHVLADRCTGCDLCLPPCPVDCISMTVVAQDWSPADATRGRSHHRARLARLTRSPPAAAAAAERDPLLALSAPAERARRLAGILERVRDIGSQ
jgi:electron transport complex protein RnfB